MSDIIKEKNYCWVDKSGGLPMYNIYNYNAEDNSIYFGKIIKI